MGALQMLVVTRLCLFPSAIAIGALQMLEFAVHAALAIRALQVLVVTSLCLFACCSYHRGFANARSEMSVFICMLLLLSGLCRCLNFVVHAALAIGAWQVLVVTRLCLFAYCYCHRGFAGACG